MAMNAITHTAIVSHGIVLALSFATVAYLLSYAADWIKGHTHSRRAPIK